jgi:hypothetical protein
MDTQVGRPRPAIFEVHTLVKVENLIRLGSVVIEKGKAPSGAALTAPISARRRNRAQFDV